MEILVTGATGLIGRELVSELLKKGHQVTVVTRKAASAKNLWSSPVKVIEAHLTEAALHDDLSSIHAVIHLMGESVAGRWTAQKKKQIYDSRILSTKNLVKSFKKAPAVFISASAIGIYGNRRDDWLDEKQTTGSDFLARVCQDWENEASVLLQLPQKESCRLVYLRTGLVLARAEQGGFLQKLRPIFKMGLGGPLGNGQQWMSWIHLQDLVRLYIFALENPQISGPVNAVSEHPVRNREFSQIFAKALGRGLGPSVPRFALKLTLGEAADMVLASQRVSSEKLRQSGFHCEHTDLKKSLQELCE